MDKTVPPAPGTAPEQEVVSAIKRLKETDPEVFKNLQITIGAKLVEAAVESIMSIPGEAFDQIIEYGEARNRPTSDTVVFAAKLIRDAKTKLVEHAMDGKQIAAVVNQLGEKRIRELIGNNEAADHFFKVASEQKAKSA